MKILKLIWLIIAYIANVLMVWGFSMFASYTVVIGSLKTFTFKSYRDSDCIWLTFVFAFILLDLQSIKEKLDKK